jgi:C_GCAxxG_C_C family probable redox protein
MKEHDENRSHEEKARRLFLNGCSCSQALLCAFSEETGLDESLALKLSSSFGGGMGRLREVCGAVTGMFMVAGILYGYDNLEDKNAKTEHYARIQELAARFRSENGSIICRELLGLTETCSAPEPCDRTESYYSSRPCEDLIGSAARILEEYIREKTY